MFHFLDLPFHTLFRFESTHTNNLIRKFQKKAHGYKTRKIGETRKKEKGKNEKFYRLYFMAEVNVINIVFKEFFISHQLLLLLLLY